MDNIYIFGHKNPDTDSVCGAIALSYLKNKLGIDTEPRILGTINKETDYVLKRFKEVVPLYLNDVKIQLKDVKFHKNYLFNENRSISDAFNYMNSNGITGLPLVDDAKVFKGYVSLKEIASELIYNENIKIHTSFDNLLDTLQATDYIKFDDYIEGSASTAIFDELPVVNSLDLNSKSIIIVGPRDDIIEYAIEKHVKLIILVQNRKLSSHLRKQIRDERISVICTPKSSFQVARVLPLANPIKTIKRSGAITTFNVLDYLSDFQETTSRLKHTNYPILNNKDQCVGMLRTIDAHETKRKKVILVDHNNSSQSVDGLYEAEIIEIIDHHNLGDISTSQPINFRNMSVGSVNTIIYYIYKENNIRIPKNIAGIMLSGIISDTLLLKSPTTTPIDRLVAEELAQIANLDLQKFGVEVLASGVSIEGLTPNDIIFKDFKTYKVGENTMAIGQVFTTDFKNYNNIKESIIEELDRLEHNHDYKLCTLFVTNFFTNDSYVLYSANSKKILEIAYGIEELTQGMILKGIVSRKKQMVPNIMPIVEKL